jgi:hypothetical protein
LHTRVNSIILTDGDLTMRKLTDIVR